MDLMTTKKTIFVKWSTLEVYTTTDNINGGIDIETKAEIFLSC